MFIELLTTTVLFWQEPAAQMRRDHEPTSLEMVQTRFRNGFAKVDANADGQLSAAELDAEPANGVGPALLRSLRNADANEDGAVSLDEALAQAERGFRRQDVNGDGMVTQAERDQRAARQSGG